MVRRIGGSLPLAFVLAMAAEAVGTSHDPAKPLRAGDLRELLDAAGDENIAANSFMTSGDRRLPGDKIAQFPNFNNFLNCNSGTWRNC
jgi:hypothetical protein